MASVLYQSIETLSRDKGIEPAIVVGAVEDAIALATRKYYKTQENMRAEMDKETGEIRAYVFKTVVEGPEQVEDEINQLTLEQARELAPEVEVGGELRFYKDTSPLGRIAAQMAKQVIFQKVREAERDTVFLEYNHRAGEVLNATVKRLEPMDVIFDLGKAEARMPKREQSRLEQFAVGERVRVVLLRVDRAAKGPQVIVSRAAPGLVQNLFQSEVPEIYDGTVTIRAIAREAGERTKIAVMSRDKDVDPVGACVGMKGMRVQSIIRELRGEKIDIKSEEEKRQEVEQQMQSMGAGPTTPVEQITELGEGILEKLIAAGITTVEELADMTPEQLEEIPGIGEKTLEKISVAVRHYFGQYEEGEERPVVAVAEPAETAEKAALEGSEVESEEKTPEELLAAKASSAGRAKETRDVSAEEIADSEEEASKSDGFSDADVREEKIELQNDAVDTLVNDSQEVSDEGVDDEGSGRG